MGLLRQSIERLKDVDLSDVTDAVKELKTERDRLQKERFNGALSDNRNTRNMLNDLSATARRTAGKS